MSDAAPSAPDQDISDLRDEIERLRGIEAVCQQLEESLRDSERRFEEISDLTSDIYFSFLVHPDATVTAEWLTGALTRVTEYSIAELAEVGWTQLIHPDEVERTASWFMALTEGDHRSFLQRIISKSGEAKWIRAHIRFDRTEDGNNLRCYGAGRDISNQIRDVEARRLLEARMQETQRLESLELLARGVAHDLNNLLTTILGNTRLLDDGLPEGTPGRARLNRVQSAAHHASDLANQLLRYSGQSDLVTDTIDLTRLIVEIQDLLESAVSNRTRVDYSFPSDPVEIEGDPTQVRQIAVNLVTNASEALGQGGGRVHVRTGWGAPPADHLAYRGAPTFDPNAIHAYLEVSDTGCGIPPETRNRIFDPFFSTKLSGRGLGLAAVLGIVRSHSGAIAVTSDSGAGTTIRVFFPGLDTQHLTPVRASSETRTPGTILVVEDDEATAKRARAALEGAGFDVLVSRAGPPSAQLVREMATKIDLVLFDASLPDLPGGDTFALVSQVRAGPPILLAATFQDPPPHLPKADAYLAKPYSSEALLALVRRLLVGTRE